MYFGNKTNYLKVSLQNYKRKLIVIKDLLISTCGRSAFEF